MKKPKTFRLDENQLEYVNNVISRWLKDNPGTYEPDFLMFSCKLYDKGTEWMYESEEISKSDKEFKDSINCDLFDKEYNNYVCYDTMDSLSKAPKILGTDKNIVYKRCMGCKNKKRIKTFEKVGYKMMNVIKKIKGTGGGIAHICNGGEDPSISLNDETFVCPLTGYKRTVKIENECKQRINPKTGYPPCENYLAVPHGKVDQSWKEEVEEILKELPYKDEVDTDKKFVESEKINDEELEQNR